MSVYDGGAYSGGGGGDGIPLNQKGAANGVCPLDGSAKVSSTYLPSYVDDVLEYANLAAFPVTGETGKIYVALDTNKTYRWSGSVYVEISASPSSIVGITGTTAQFNTALTDNDFATLAGAESLTNKKLGSLTSNGFVKTSGGDGTLSVDVASYQPLDGDLTAIAALTGTGFLQRTGTDTWTLSAGTGGSGLSYFTESQSITSPNATNNIAGLTVVAPSTHAHFAIIPKGTNGGITTSIADGTAAGGNAIGNSAISLLTGRSTATQGATGLQAIAVGYRATASATNVVAIGNTATGSGDSSVAIGTVCTASAVRAVAIGNSATATNTDTISIGRSATASGNQSTAMGLSASANGGQSLALGDSTTASNTGSIALGSSSSVNGDNSVSVLQGRVNGRSGVIAYAPGNESVAGDSQILLGSVYRNRTSDATPTALTSDSLTTRSTSNILVLQNYSQQIISLNLNAIRKGSEGSGRGAWNIRIVAYRGANAASTTIDDIDVLEMVNTLGVTPNFTAGNWIKADTTNGGIYLEVVGIAAQNIQWVAGVYNVTENVYA